MDLFFGVDYHSHLGTRRGGMAVYNGTGFDRSIHNIENSPFRTKFEHDVSDMSGNMGIGCISDSEPQPLVVHSHLGTYALTTVGRINNKKELVNQAFSSGNTHFLEMSGGDINSTELVAALINQQSTFVKGIKYAQSVIEGSMSLLLLTNEGMYASRDTLGRTPIVLGAKDGAYCASFESFAYLNLDYHDLRELGPAEIVFMTPDNVEVCSPASSEMRICAFLWTYYGYPSSAYEGMNVEVMRYRCGANLAKNDDITADYVAGVPDSGTAHAIGYANESGIPFARPFIKYTPTWPRSFMPQDQSIRNLIARMKLIPIDQLIRGKSLIFLDDSIVRGTQLRETVEFLYKSGAKEVHVRPACPPLVFSCKFLNFSWSTSELDLITRRVILEREGSNAENMLSDYSDSNSENYREMVKGIGDRLNLTSIKFNKLDDLVDAIGIPSCKVCTYCWNGKE
ncbi:MAG TPA: amidophosphoribosyltransferase, partial [Clostridia bacterium]|nr:amidophosphoribosyltransferase [Clostridia bacterium]